MEKEGVLEFMYTSNLMSHYANAWGYLARGNSWSVVLIIRDISKSAQGWSVSGSAAGKRFGIVEFHGPVSRIKLIRL